MENPFFGGFNEGLKQVVPLAMRKWEIDQANEKWNQQLQETKRAHDLNSGIALINAGMIPQAEAVLSRATGTPVTGLANSPQNLGRLAEEKLRTAKANSEMRKIELLSRFQNVLERGKMENALVQPPGNLDPEAVNLESKRRDLTTTEALQEGTKLLPEVFLGKLSDTEQKNTVLDMKEKLQNTINTVRERGQDMGNQSKAEDRRTRELIAAISAGSRNAGIEAQNARAAAKIKSGQEPKSIDIYRAEKIEDEILTASGRPNFEESKKRIDPEKLKIVNAARNKAGLPTLVEIKRTKKGIIDALDTNLYQYAESGGITTGTPRKSIESFGTANVKR
jgi:hypothetical protein